MHQSLLRTASTFRESHPREKVMPREFVRSLIPAVHPEWPVIKQHIPAMFGILGLMVVFYLLNAYVGAGRLSYAVSIVIMFLLFITSLARLNVIEHTRIGFRWQFRRFGWLAIIVTSVGLTIMEAHAPPSWRQILFRFGWLAIVMTTPMMPPWHRFMSGKSRKVVEVEVPADAEVNITRTAAPDGMFEERRTDRASATEQGP